MTLWNKLFRGLKASSPKIQLPGSLTVGRWVLVDSRIAIIAAIKDAESAEIHFVGENGETTLVAFVPWSQISQASWKDIPAVRRPAKSLAASLGYSVE